MISLQYYFANFKTDIFLYQPNYIILLTANIQFILFSVWHYSCKLCGKEYTASYLINRHMLAHADRKDNPCGLCGNTFKTAPELKAHLRVHEEDDVKYTHCCELCGKRYAHSLCDLSRSTN